MKNFQRAWLAVLLSFSVLAWAQPSQAAFSKLGGKCRGQVAKNAAKYAKITAKVMVGCHKTRDKTGVGDCSTLALADANKGKAAKTAGKFRDLIGGIKDKCNVSELPADLLYFSCPAGNGSPGCAAPIATFSDVADCLICLIDDSVEAMSVSFDGAPSVPFASKNDGKCHKTVGKTWSKLAPSTIKDVTKCQSKDEKGGTQTIDSCTQTNFPSSKLVTIVSKAKTKLADLCAAANLANVASCDQTSQLALADCVGNGARDGGLALATLALQLGTSTPTTTLPPPPVQDPACPDSGEIVLFAGTSNIPCATNVDCALPRTCDAGLHHRAVPGRCASAPPPGP